MTAAARTQRTVALRKIVRDHGLSHADLARLIGCSEAHARGLTCGAWVPSARVVRLLELEVRERGK